MDQRVLILTDVAAGMHHVSLEGIVHKVLLYLLLLRHSRGK
jgi:hypothetical protein